MAEATKNNTMLYVVLGLLIISIGGNVYFFLTRNKPDNKTTGNNIQDLPTKEESEVETETEPVTSS